MANKVMVSGKHPIVVRIDDELYKKLSYMAVDENESVNAMIARWCMEKAKKADKKE